MTDDRQRLSRIQAEQDRALASYLRREVGAYSPFYRGRIPTDGGVRRTADLATLPFTSLAEVDDPASLVLRPEPEQVLVHGQPGLRWSLRIAGLVGQTARTAKQRIDPMYKPLHWVLTDDGRHDGLPIGSSAADLDRLAELGRRWLEQAGVRPTDVLVSVLPPGPHLDFWQLQLGARRGGVSTLLLDLPAAPADLERLQPTVLAGRAADLIPLLTEARLPGLTTILTAGEPLDPALRQRLQSLAPGAAVVAAWAPPGARAVWAECRGGDAFHTWPDSEVIEIDDGELVWTALGWRGSVLVRLRTGVVAELDRAQCPVCGRTTPRLRITGRQPPFASVLSAHHAIGGWHAELRSPGKTEDADELIVFVSPADGNGPESLVPALHELDARLGSSVTQFVVVDRSELDELLAANGQQPVADRRAASRRPASG